MIAESMDKAKILIVDDEPFNLEYLEQELEDTAISIIKAVNGQECLNKAGSEFPDLILLDIMMPIMDGFEVLRHLRENETFRDIPVIIISANSDLQNIVKGIELGAEDYLPKPFDPAILHARVSSSLEKKRLRDIEKLYFKSLERELEIGREIQSGFLPEKLPQIDGWEIASYFKSAKEVAGDFYDAFQLANSTLVFLVGDVCGKGVGAALFMALFRSLIRVTATNEDDHPGLADSELSSAERLLHLINFTNHYVADTHSDNNLFATLFIGFLDTMNGRMAYANCGNEPPILIDSSGLISELKPTGPVIGAFPEAEFLVKEIHIKPGQMLFAFTDGITDAIDLNQKSFGRDRLIDFLRKVNDSPNLVIEGALSELECFSEGQSQFDDITLLSIKKKDNIKKKRCSV
jgi:serine phosphatase RsbU (regulator of sigma subunit)